TLPSIFFFQAEDGIRDGHVTGVQTCALPISHHGDDTFKPLPRCRTSYPGSVRLGLFQSFNAVLRTGPRTYWDPELIQPRRSNTRSEERRVGKESQFMRTGRRERIKLTLNKCF